MNIKTQNPKNSLVTGTAVGVFVIPIILSFIMGGIVLSLALGGHLLVAPTTKSEALQILNLQDRYSTSDSIKAAVSINDPKFSCGDLYITIYEVTSGSKKAVKQEAFFKQCFEAPATLPLDKDFAVTIESAGKYLLEAQLFDEKGSSFVSSNQKFTVE